MRPIKALLLFLTVLGASRQAVLRTASAQPPKLRMGLILPLTGDAAAIGQAIKNGAELALSELPDEQWQSIELRIEDDAFVPAQTVSAYRRLQTNGGLHVVMSVGSNTSNALAPITEQDQVPLLAVASDPAVSRGRLYASNFWVMPAAEVDVLLPEIRRLGYRIAARISTVHSFPDALNGELDRRKGELSFVLDSSFQPEVKDFRPYIAKLRADPSIQAVFVVLMPGQVGVFAKQAREGGYRGPFVGFEFMEDPNEVAQAQGALEGAIYVNAADAGAAFKENYQKRFPGASLLGAANGYDALKVLASALPHCASGAELAHYLRSLTDVAASGGKLSAVGDGTFSFPAALKEIRNGLFTERKR